MTPIRVDCTQDRGGWSCRVTVGDDPHATEHVVDVEAADLRRWRPGAETPEELVRAAVEFLLTREPREAILRRFDLPVIGRYFPDWETDLKARLSAPDRSSST